MHALLSPATLASCELCPRRCGVNRASGARGVCGADGTLRLARAALHFWEEPPISGEAGSGTIFFSGCPLKCIYCQNHEISTGNFGLKVLPGRLAEIMLELQEQGALNINLVTATHYAHLLPAAIAAARARGLRLPIVYNTSGYEHVQAVRELAGAASRRSAVPAGSVDVRTKAADAHAGTAEASAAAGDSQIGAPGAPALVDIWLTDFKYADPALGARLSHVPDYPEVAAAALAAMVEGVRAHGGIAYDEAGIMQRGIIVRHLVLPGHADDSCRVLDRIWDVAGDVPISVMNQYTPNAAMRAAGGDLARAVTDDEYERVLAHADDLGFTTMFWQEGGAVDESFTPPFDTTGVRAPATLRP